MGLGCEVVWLRPSSLVSGRQHPRFSPGSAHQQPPAVPGLPRLEASRSPQHGPGSHPNCWSPVVERAATPGMRNWEKVGSPRGLGMWPREQGRELGPRLEGQLCCEEASGRRGRPGPGAPGRRPTGGIRPARPAYQREAGQLTHRFLIKVLF